MHIKFLSILSFLTIFVSGLKAQETMLVVELNDGHKQSFVLKEKPWMTFDNSQMTVGYSGDTVSYFLANIRDYHFDDIPESIEHIVGNELRFARENEDLICVYGLEESIKRMTVSDINGRTAAVDVKGNVGKISLQGMPAGIYVIKAGNQSIKINKK